MALSTWSYVEINNNERYVDSRPFFFITEDLNLAHKSAYLHCVLLASKIPFHILCAGWISFLTEAKQRNLLQVKLSMD